MPWRPPFDDSRDPKLDPFRERAGRLSDGLGPKGWVYVRPWMTAQQVVGHLWWRRWAPQREVAAGYVLMDQDDVRGDWVDKAEEVAREVADWSLGRFTWRGIHYSVSWANIEESRRVRDAVFGLGGPDQ